MTTNNIITENMEPTVKDIQIDILISIKNHVTQNTGQYIIGALYDGIIYGYFFVGNSDDVCEYERATFVPKPDEIRMNSRQMSIIDMDKHINSASFNNLYVAHHITDHAGTPASITMQPISSTDIVQYIDKMLAYKESDMKKKDLSIVAKATSPLQIIPHIWNGQDATTGYRVMIEADIKKKNHNTLYLFNDNTSDHKTADSGAANGEARPYNKHSGRVPPYSAGISTGDPGVKDPVTNKPGFRSLNCRTKKIIDDEVKEIKDLIREHKYKRIMYSVVDKNGILGSSTYDPIPQVLEYITRKIVGLGTYTPPDDSWGNSPKYKYDEKGNILTSKGGGMKKHADKYLKYKMKYIQLKKQLKK